MKITNKHGLSRAWIQAVQQDSYDKTGWRSITSLINPPRITILRERHDEDIVADVTDEIWKLLGSACHYVLDAADDSDAITEQRFCIPCLGKQISMKPDRAEKKEDGTYELVDFKITGYYTTKDGPKSHWIKQVQLYAYGLRKIGFDVTSIRIECLLKDWSYTDAYVKKIRGYPPSQVLVFPVEPWSDVACRKYLEERVGLYIAAEQESDDRLPECSMQERWAEPDKWAVKKTASGNAVSGGIFTSKQEAEDFGRTKKYTPVIEFRRGKQTRCERYCPAAPFCNQYKRTKQPF